MVMRWHEETTAYAELAYRRVVCWHLIPEGREIGIAWVHPHHGGSAGWETADPCRSWGVAPSVEAAKLAAERAIGYRRRGYTPPQGARVR